MKKVMNNSINDKEIFSIYLEFLKQKKQVDEDNNNIKEVISYSNLMLENCEKLYEDEKEQLNQNIRKLETTIQKLSDENHHYVEIIKKIPVSIQKKYIKKTFLY